MEPSRLSTLLENAVCRQGLAGHTLLVGVSGGTDSLALVHGLAQIAVTRALRLWVSHLDHRLRPESSDDARYVEEIARSLELPFRVGSADVRGLARERGMGVEEAARYARLRFFAELAVETGAVAVALAHTRDDQTETRLLHLVRGAGLRGLGGMTEISNQSVDETPLRIFRPLLEVGRGDTEAYCAAVKLQPRDDRSNHDLAFSRNRMRHAVLPPLRTLNPRLDEAMERLGRTARAAEDFVEAELDRRLPELVDAREPRWVILREQFRELPEALKRGLVRRAAEATGAVVGSEAIETAMQAAESWPSGTEIAWPNECDVKIEHAWLSIGPRAYPSNSLGAPGPQPVELPADGDVPIHLPSSLGGRERPVAVVLRVRRRGGMCARSRDRWHADFDNRKLGGPLAVRGRRPGDRLAAEGIRGTKKLQDLLVDAHIPRAERNGVLVVTAADTVAWVVGLRRNRDLLAEPACRDVLCCEVVEPNSTDTGEQI